MTGAISISIGAGSANNQANILSSGFVHAINVAAVDLSGAADGNVVSNAGTISSASGTAIIGSANQDTIINSGTIISGGVSTAVDLKGGNDVFELRAGSSITGWVLGGSGTDTLRLGGTASAAFNLGIFGAAGQFREFEALEKTGSSTWTMNGSTTEIASMNILAGTLEVNGSMPNIATTVSGGILSGNGAIGNMTVLSGGTVLPGNLGTLTSNGNVTFNAGSTYAISVTATGQSEKILAVNATLNGGTVAVNTIAGAYNPSTQYTILSTTTGVIGSFSRRHCQRIQSAALPSSLSYDGFSVFLTLNYNNAAFLSIAQTQNQKAVAGALSAFGPNLPFLSSFAGESDAQLRYSLDQLSGEAATGAQQGAFQFTSQFLGLMLDPFVGGRSGMSTGDTALGFSPERAALPDDIALAYNKVLKDAGHESAGLCGALDGLGHGVRRHQPHRRRRRRDRQSRPRRARRRRRGRRRLSFRPRCAWSVSRCRAAAPNGISRRRSAGARAMQSRPASTPPCYRASLFCRLSRRGQSLDVDRSARTVRQPAHRQIRRANRRRPHRGRLSLRHADWRLHAICGDAGAEVSHAGLYRGRSGRRRLA